MVYYAHIRSGTVVNASRWDGQAPAMLGRDMLVAMPEKHDGAGRLVPSVGIGWQYADGMFIAPPPVEPEALSWDDIRAERDRLLAACDWTQVADAPVDAASWAVYRQALRDIPQDFASPDAVVWPEQP